MEPFDGLTIFVFICKLKIMFVCLTYAANALPDEYRIIAEELFPSEGFSEEKGPSVEAAKAFSGILGIGEEYSRLWEAQKSNHAMGEFLDHFQNNLDLLIQKTWVEKADEIRKERLLDQVPPFIVRLDKGDYPGALEEFGAILEELAYLFFGAQSQKEDFGEYTLRIDTQMGLFWWYGGQLSGARGAPWVKSADESVLRAMLLLGICYLTNF